MAPTPRQQTACLLKSSTLRKQLQPLLPQTLPNNWMIKSVANTLRVCDLDSIPSLHSPPIGKKLGSGQYADVFSAHLVSDPTQLVAIKKIKVGPEVQEWGISHDSLREIKFLQELSHPNIIRLYSVFSTKNQNLNLVLEQLPQGDLLKLIQDTNNINYNASDIEAWMVML